MPIATRRSENIAGVAPVENYARQIGRPQPTDSNKDTGELQRWIMDRLQPALVKTGIPNPIDRPCPTTSC
ncbi:hypothetical protein NHX12_014260 [Muraenolepis orangiensis]|uniref:Uncharacterized protein n=1 Tax=Muraenolepis orangiensis TaxID=630683 RepID=A0A9Q0DD87_9TELE|nr:hypothetical protein NHX12_014260 [Muraenolepis orangiensis]